MHMIAAFDEPGVTHIVGFMLVVGLFLCMPLWVGAFLRLVRTCLWVLRLPFVGLVGFLFRVKDRRKARNYALLANYIPRFEEHPVTVARFQALVERGISTSDLRSQLEQVDRSRRESEVAEAISSSQLGQQLTELRCQHEEILAEAEVELVRMRHQNQAMGTVLDRIEDKYLENSS